MSRKHVGLLHVQCARVRRLLCVNSRGPWAECIVARFSVVSCSTLSSMRQFTDSFSLSPGGVGFRQFCLPCALLTQRPAHMPFPDPGDSVASARTSRNVLAGPRTTRTRFVTHTDSIQNRKRVRYGTLAKCPSVTVAACDTCHVRGSCDRSCCHRPPLSR